jgi:hypothetical protein
LEEVLGDGENASVDDNTNANVEDAVVDPGRVAELAFKEEQWAHYGKREKTGNSSYKGKSCPDLEVGSPLH